MKKKGRPNIPRATQLKLWLKSGGRCQFKGCNEPLWVEGLTLSESNYSQIAHIVSYSPIGPRGDKSRSKKLSVEYDNLLLLCPTHHHLIDEKQYEKEYSENKLLKWKLEHETRISTLTSITDSFKADVITYVETINSYHVNFDQNKIKKALLPMYPNSNTFIKFDFTAIKTEGPSYFDTIQKTLKTEMHTKISKQSKVAIFALGKIPSLIQFGLFLGNKTDVEIYNYLRNNSNWGWKHDKSLKVRVVNKISNPKCARVALVLSLSGKITKAKIKKTIPDIQNLVEITIQNPQIDSISSKNSFETIKNKIHEALSLCRENLEIGYTLEVFASASCPIAIELGRSLNTKIEKINIYDLNKNGRYIKIGKLK